MNLQPVLAFGPRKSGTTLLHNLLDGGSELLMLPSELKLQRILKKIDSPPPALIRHYLNVGRLDFGRMLKWPNDELQLDDDFYFDGLSHDQMRDVFDIERYVNQLREMFACPSVISANANSLETPSLKNARQVIDYDVTAFVNSVKNLSPNLKFWAAKEISSKPELALKFWRQLYPEGRIVYLVRQPEFIVRSILNDRRRKGIHLPLRTIWFHCFEAQHLINFAYAAAKWPREERPVFLSYEEMTASPETVLRRVARELGLAFEPVLAKPTTLGVPMIVRTSSRATTEIFQQTTSWQDGLTRRELLAIQMYKSIEPLVFRRHRETMVPYAEMQARLAELATA